MHEIYEELRDEYEELFNELYVKPTYRELFVNLPSDQEMVYDNSTRTVSVRIAETGEFVTEYVFVCLSRNKSSGKISRFYVTEEYNVSDTPSENYIAGRFIFGNVLYEIAEEQYASGEEQFDAIAEEPAQVLLLGGARDNSVESLYLQRRAENEPGEF